MALFVYKVGGFEELETFLQGGIVGGASDLAGKQLFLHGKTLVLTSPASETVTFASTPTNAQVPISLKDVIAQIAAQSSIKARYVGKRFHLLHDASPSTTAVVISGTSTALEILGFNSGSGKFYNPPSGAAPRLISFEPSSNGDGSFTVVTEET
jgi:hypothetical protein